MCNPASEVSNSVFYLQHIKHKVNCPVQHIVMRIQPWVSFHVHFHHFCHPTPMACSCWPKLTVGSGHFSSLHFVVYLSLCEPNLSQVNHNIDSLPACQRVRVHAGVHERMEGLRGGKRQTHESLACCEDGGWRWPSKTLFTLCSA